MLATRAAKLNFKSKGTPIYGVIDWIALLPMLLGLLSLCKKPVTPAPVNPTPNPTPVQSAAWSDAWGLKSAAADNWDGAKYTDKVVRVTANRIRKERRKDGSPISKSEAHAAALLALDDGRLSTMADLYSDVLEARHAV